MKFLVCMNPLTGFLFLRNYVARTSLFYNVTCLIIRSLYSIGAVCLLEQELDIAVVQFRAANFAETTKMAYQSHRKAYILFCIYMGYPPAPATPLNICRYAAFLARSLKYKSIKQYLNIIGVLHKELALPNPLVGNWMIQTTLRGIRRKLGDEVNQKMPITPDILLKIHSRLDFSRSFDASFWAACLIGFFCFLRKSNLFGDPGSFSKSCVQRADISIYQWGLVVAIRHSKTIQYREKVVRFPLPRISDSPLCPRSAISTAFRFTVRASATSSAFMFSDLRGNLKTLSYRSFVSKLRSCLSEIGYNPLLYAGHSLRRGGASFAFLCGVPADLIKMQGDWASNSYQLYLTVPLRTRFLTASIISSKLMSL